MFCVVTLLATPAAAQTTTEDGIRAMLRGDYKAAASIFRPLAYDTARPDPVAQFFLAILYDTGNGVGRDMGRACGLFLRAAKRAHPFSEQSATIGAFMRDQLGDGAGLLCVADERWQGGPPQSFTLGPNHQVVFADTSIDVRYGDQEHRTTLLLSPHETYLPIRYTPLAVTRPVISRRHFFQWFVWVPDTTLNPSSWTLGWTLSEVVKGQWIGILSEKLAVVSGPTRPASYDVAGLVRLQVNASGEAEFTIVNETPPRTKVIPWLGNQ